MCCVICVFHIFFFLSCKAVTITDAEESHWLCRMGVSFSNTSCFWVRFNHTWTNIINTVSTHLKKPQWNSSCSIQSKTTNKGWYILRLDFFPDIDYWIINGMEDCSIYGFQNRRNLKGYKRVYFGNESGSPLYSDILKHCCWGMFILTEISMWPRKFFIDFLSTSYKQVKVYHNYSFCSLWVPWRLSHKRYSINKIAS